MSDKRAMSDHSVHSAEIFQFPRRGRFATNISDEAAAAEKSQRVVRMSGGGAWYHDEAIADERKS